MAVEAGQLGADFVCFLVALFTGRDGPLAVLYPREDGLHRVVIDLRHGIELVIMATGTADRQTQEGAAGRADHVVQLVGPLLGVQHRIALDLVVGPGHEEAGGLALAARVPGELIADELVVRLVVVQGADDVVAVGPGVGPGRVGLEAGALGKVDHVEPVPGQRSPKCGEAR